MRYSMCRGCVRQVVVYRGVREESNQSFQSWDKQICIRSLTIALINRKIGAYIYRPLNIGREGGSVTLSSRYC